MKNQTIKTFIALIAVSSSIMAYDNGAHRGNHGSDNTNQSNDTQDTVLSQELANTLSHMGNEERLAYDVYNRLYQEWGTQQFSNIASKSEIKHIQAVQTLVKKYNLNDSTDFTNVDLPSLGYANTPVPSMQAGTYDISKIQGLYDDLVTKGLESEEEALKVGCIIEVVDINDLDEYVDIAQKDGATDIVSTFDNLRKGSYNHYWAFDKELKNIGVSDGCCSIGDEYCHPDYPKNQKGNGNKNANKHKSQGSKGNKADTKSKRFQRKNRRNTRRDWR